MNRIEHLLTILSEECVETAQRASKAMRFGLDEIQPGQPLTNEERMWFEFADLTAAVEMVMEERGSSLPESFWEHVAAKKAKVEKFLLYSAQCGTLTEPGTAAEGAEG